MYNFGNLDRSQYQSDNILSEGDLVKKIEELRAIRKVIGLCTGSFDLLHPGHVTHLTSARKYCDVLVVAVANDDFNKAKGVARGRPVFPDYIRAYMVSKLRPVDFVIIDDGSTRIHKLIKPDVHIKGPDYADEKDPRIIAQKKMLASWGGRLVYTKDDKLSTTDIINYIKREVS